MRSRGARCAGYGGVVSFELEADLAGAARFIDALRIPYIGPSLGGVESIVEQPALMSHFTLTEAASAPRSASAARWCAMPWASRTRPTSWPTCRRRWTV